VLHEVFSFPFGKVADVIGKSEAACRQLASRARRVMEDGRPRFDVDRREREKLAARSFDAMTAGDVDALRQLLAADVEVYGDGGGKAPQWMRVIVGYENVARMFAGLGRRFAGSGLQVEPHQVNGQPGAVLRDPEGRVINVLALDVLDRRIEVVRSIINPDKLRHIGPVADAWALMHRTPPDPRR
jgi:RNA polymerase sigma-70 factor, ECF subfamily